VAGTFIQLSSLFFSTGTYTLIPMHLHLPLLIIKVLQYYTNQRHMQLRVFTYEMRQRDAGRRSNSIDYHAEARKALVKCTNTPVRCNPSSQRFRSDQSHPEAQCNQFNIISLNRIVFHSREHQIPSLIRRDISLSPVFHSSANQHPFHHLLAMFL